MADYNVSNFEQGMSGLNQDYLNLKSQYDTAVQGIQEQKVTPETISKMANQNIKKIIGTDYNTAINRLNQLSSALVSNNEQIIKNAWQARGFYLQKLSNKYPLLESMMNNVGYTQSTGGTQSTPPTTNAQQDTEFNKVLENARLNKQFGTTGVQYL